MLRLNTVLIIIKYRLIVFFTLQRFVLITDGPVVRTVAVEEDPSQVTITAADVILAQL